MGGHARNSFWHRTEAKAKIRNSGRTLRALIIVAFGSALCDYRTNAAPVVLESNAAPYSLGFGYLSPVEPGSEKIILQEEGSTAISNSTRRAALTRNSQDDMDVESAHPMTLPRCGVEDTVEPTKGGRTKRYAFAGGKWGKNDLTYRITKYSNNSKSMLNQSLVRGEIARAFAEWSKHTNLTFTPKFDGKVDIEIKFERGEHGDEGPFDGRGGVLAHASRPMHRAFIHFDDAEDWTIDSCSQVDLFATAVHEIGHSLGLDHSSRKSAVMYSTDTLETLILRCLFSSFELDDDDINGIQALYGPEERHGLGLENIVVYI